MLTHVFTRNWSAGGSSVTGRVSVTGGAEINLDEAVANGATNALLAFAMDVSQLKGLFIKADVAMTLETNSGSSPANTIALAAGVPFVWANGDPSLRDTAGTAITTDITSLFVTNASGADGTLQVRALYDPTV